MTREWLPLVAIDQQGAVGAELNPEAAVVKGVRGERRLRGGEQSGRQRQQRDEPGACAGGRDPHGASS
jgi:hypothetical protein